MKIVITALILLVVSISGCSKALPPSIYGSNEIGILNKVQSGIILSKRQVYVNANEEIDQSQKGRRISANEISAGVTHQQGFEYIIRLEDGKVVSVVQADDMKFKVNQRVFVVYGETTHIIPNQSAKGK